MAAIYFGYCAGPFLGGYVTHLLGWRSIFFVNVFVGLLVICFVVWKLKGEWLGAVDEKFDLAGSIIYGIALFLILYGFSQLSSVTGLSLVLLGVMGVLFFMK